MKRNIPFDIKVATTVQNLTNEFKGNLEKILAGSHLHHNRSRAFYPQTHQLCTENSKKVQHRRADQASHQPYASPHPQAACRASWQPPPPQQKRLQARKEQ